MLKETDPVIVCDKCLRACCWYSEFMCDDARGAGLKILSVADLRRLKLESEDYWQDKKMIEIYGNADRDFRV